MNEKCILPWIHLEASATGIAKPCCLTKDPIIINGVPATFEKNSISEIWNSDYMNNLREQFLRGEKPATCSACWDQERIGKQSKRQQSNEQYSHRRKRWQQQIQPPTYLDLKLGTVCNLKCRSCSTHSSFKWAEDEIQLYGETFNQDLKSYWIQDESKVWKEIEELLPEIEYMDFTGGEPFLIKKHFDLLKKCVELDYAKNIELHYNTNGTVLPKEEIFEVWRNFKSVDVMFSIDGIEEKFEYLRCPGKWHELTKTWETFLSYSFIHTSICYSVTIFNVMYMQEFVDWLQTYNMNEDRIYFNIIFDPKYLNIQSMSRTAKKFIVDYYEKNRFFSSKKIKEVLDFMNADDLVLDNPNEFFENTKKLDQIRNEDFAHTFPTLAGILDYEHSR